MRIAWFRADAPDARNLLDDTAPLIDELRSAHDIDVIVEANAHDFVWRQTLRPWDICVYELDHTRPHAFIWAYLINYPGVVMLRSMAVAHLRVPLFASRCIVTTTTAAADLLRARYDNIHVRVVPLGVAAANDGTHRSGGAAKLLVVDDRDRGRDVVRRALERARDAGATFELLAADAPVHACDVLISPEWPPFRHVATTVLAGMAAGKAVVTMEMDATADWPAMDPQTWRPRGIGADQLPIVVTVDPLDEEHSLLLAVRRLSSDAALREQLGHAAHAWWKQHATPAHAAKVWNHILEEAVGLNPPPRPNDWPQQFSRDGTELAREILTEIGVPPTDILARS
ncbi:MAG TPA: hypothetical protein VL693_00795 [Vicinamibacterales bacterium]|jgi:hypothetical protein|nr:hypothetical protein [Vicinamibacterales bacterium]